MAGPSCRYRVDWHLDPFAFSQSGQYFDIVADRPSQSNGPAADCTMMGCHFNQVQLPYALHRLTRNDQNLLFVEWNQDSAEHAAVHALRTRASDLYLECSAAGLCFRHNLADRASALLSEVLNLHFNRLADLQSVSKRLADT